MNDDMTSTIWMHKCNMKVIRQSTNVNTVAMPEHLFFKCSSKYVNASRTTEQSPGGEKMTYTSRSKAPRKTGTPCEPKLKTW